MFCKYKSLVTSLLTSCFLLFTSSPAFTWGFFAHKKINQLAVFTLHPEMISFYKKHIDYISRHGVDPDKRRYSDKEEAARHYIDIDHYGEHPFDSIPFIWKKAVIKYSEDTLQEYGIIPWYIEKMMYRLTKAFKEKNVDRILYLSANIGHYIADAHVPLHTTGNYNGQLTNQQGIHGFWESRVPELFADQWDFFVGRVKYIDKINDKIWEIVKASNVAKDSVLLFEAELNMKSPTDKKFSYEKRGNNTVKVYSKEYAANYEQMLNEMVKRRMCEAVLNVGSFWYTAWVDAGMPKLDSLLNKEVADSLKIVQQEREEILKTGKIKNPKGHEE
ncbi:MAG: zinc dependent phospholipase C family protein [Bacteroidota bacterium]